jgi:large subunit ribosomal protein L10e
VCSHRFPGRQKIIVSKNWGFTPLRRDEYIEKRQNGEVQPDGAYVKFLRPHGNLAANVKAYPAAFAAIAAA